MRQRSTDSIDLTKFTAQTNAPPVRQSRVEMHSFVPSSDPSQRLPATTRRLRQNPRPSLSACRSRDAAAVLIAPVTALAVASLHRCRSARHQSLARAPATAAQPWQLQPHTTRRRRGPRAPQLRARQSPVRLQSRTTVHETATLTRRRDDARSRNAKRCPRARPKGNKSSPSAKLWQDKKRLMMRNQK